MFLRLCWRAPRTTSRSMGMRELARAGRRGRPPSRTRGPWHRFFATRRRWPKQRRDGARADPEPPPVDRRRCGPRRRRPRRALRPRPPLRSRARARPSACVRRCVRLRRARLRAAAGCPPDMTLVDGDFCPDLPLGCVRPTGAGRLRRVPARRALPRASPTTGATASTATSGPTASARTRWSTSTGSRRRPSARAPGSGSAAAPSGCSPARARSACRSRGASCGSRARATSTARRSTSTCTR